jgi:hypothetical protein
MRRSILASGLLALACASLALAPAHAQGAVPATLPAPTLTASQSSEVPRPVDPNAFDYYRAAAITAGAVGGIIVANVLTAGLAAPAAAAATGTGAAAVTASAAPAIAAGQVAISAVGAVVGGYVGNWLYGSR